MENREHKRASDDQQAHFRSGRFYSVANEWYFCVREKEDQGPFSSKALAEESLITYLMDYESFNTKNIKFDLNKIKIN
ncbi:MAG: DUF6316 family protein [Gammaproteobacteria bacterium]|nr:DUF6316 family protein [Gammaproteobacteria bacterium]MCW8987273.1 DUF6316 family protein [Gammaproteobacteria bacterium]